MSTRVRWRSACGNSCFPYLHILRAAQPLLMTPSEADLNHRKRKISRGRNWLNKKDYWNKISIYMGNIKLCFNSMLRSQLPLLKLFKALTWNTANHNAKSRKMMELSWFWTLYILLESLASLTPAFRGCGFSLKVKASIVILLWFWWMVDLVKGKYRIMRYHDIWT